MTILREYMSKYRVQSKDSLRNSALLSSGRLERIWHSKQISFLDAKVFFAFAILSFLTTNILYSLYYLARSLLALKRLIIDAKSRKEILYVSKQQKTHMIRYTNHDNGFFLVKNRWICIADILSNVIENSFHTLLTFSCY